MDDHHLDPAIEPLPAIDASIASPSPSREPSMEPSVHDDHSVHDDLSDVEREADEHSEAEDDASASEEEDVENQNSTPRVNKSGEKFRLSSAHEDSILSAAKIPLNDSEQTDYSEISDSSEVEDNVSLSGEVAGYGSEHEYQSDRDMEDDMEDQEEDDKENEDENENFKEEEYENIDTVPLQSLTPERRNKRPLPKSGPGSSFGRTPAKSHFSDAFITPHANKYISSSKPQSTSSLFAMPAQETQGTPKITDTPDQPITGSAPASTKINALQFALAEREKRIRHLEEMLAGDSTNNDLLAFTPEKRVKTSHYDSPGARRTEPQQASQSVIQSTPPQSNIARERASAAPSPIRYLANIFDDISHGAIIPSPPTKEERKADKRRRMTRELRDFSAIELPTLKKVAPQVEAVLEEEEEEEEEEKGEQQAEATKTEETKPEETKTDEPTGEEMRTDEPKPEEIDTVEPTKAADAEVPNVEEQVTEEADAEHSVPKTTTESVVDEIIETSRTIPSIPISQFDPRRRRATSAPIDGPDSRPDESFPNFSFLRKDAHTIQALQKRIDELEKELSTATTALTIATSALAAERRARIDAEETRRFMEVERQVGACCHARDELDKLHAQLQLQQEQENRKLAEVARKMALEREEREREREEWEKEKERLEQEHAKQERTDLRKRPAPGAAAPSRMGPNRPASSTSHYEPTTSARNIQTHEDAPVQAPRNRLAAEVPAPTTNARVARSSATGGTASSQQRSAAIAPTAASKKVLNPSQGNVIMNSQGGGHAMRKAGGLGAKGGIDKLGGGPQRPVARKVDAGHAARSNAPRSNATSGNSISGRMSRR